MFTAWTVVLSRASTLEACRVMFMAAHAHRLSSPLGLFFYVRQSPYISPFSTFSAITSTQISPAKNMTFSHIFQECATKRALAAGKQGHSRMVVSGFNPTVFVTNCLIQMYVKCRDSASAFKVFDEMPHRDTVSWNVMLYCYISRGKMALARELFEAMPRRDVISWNSLIYGYLENEDLGKSIDAFSQMGKSGISFDQSTFAVVLKACAALEDYSLGTQIHGLAVLVGFDCHVITASALVTMYSKCHKLDDSLRFFSQTPGKNWVCWSAVIAGCVQNNELVHGVGLFIEMQRAGVGVSQSTYASVLRACAGLSAVKLGSQLHAHTLKLDFGSDVIVGTATLDMYAKCDSLLDAQKVFNFMPNQTLQTFNAIIVGYTRSGQGFKALQLFKHLQNSSLSFDEVSLSGAFCACASIKGHLEGLQVHGLVAKSSLQFNICVANAILDMYGKCGDLVEARHIFDEMVRRDAVSWNAIIAAHGQNGNEEETLSLFVGMLHSRMEPDDFTYGSVLKACAGLEVLTQGMEVHGRVIKSGMELDAFVGSGLVDMYCKCGMVEEGQKLHCRNDLQTKVSWNTIISGFSLQKQGEEAHKFFLQMLEMGVEPDNFTYATVIDTCANLANGGLGKQIHAQIIKQELQCDVYITSTLVDMYSKCGNMQDSRLLFDKAPERDVVTCNAMIAGYAYHGLAKDALQVYESMHLENVKPNHATFVAVLRACGHMGLVGKGWHYFNSMLSDHGLEPQLEHYSCMVDIVGRSGQFSKALELIQNMPFKADDIIWRTLLSTCKIHGNIEVAEKAATSILHLDPQDSSAYILLSNIYADAGMWGEVSRMRMKMRQNGLKKEPGCSWIEIINEVHTFIVGDKAHSRCEEIYERLDFLIEEMRQAGYVPGTEFFLSEVEMEQHDQQEFTAIRNQGEISM